MNIRDLFTFDSEEQKRRIDGISMREVVATECEPISGYQEEIEFHFRTVLPGDDLTGHPVAPAFNPYLFVPTSELEYLLKYKKDLSAESYARIKEAYDLQLSG